MATTMGVATLTDRKPTLARWTVADIDAAIPAVRGKRDAAAARGDTAAAAQHQGWLDRLLDARPHHLQDEAAQARGSA